MSTIGHPLADVTNLLTPHITGSLGARPGSSSGNIEFSPDRVPGLPTRHQCVKWYAEVAGWDPSPELTWGDAFNVFKGSIIMQGIAARYAVRQASSARAQDYGSAMKPYGVFAWSLVEAAKEQAAQYEAAKL